jgi:hypothetical protein
VKRGLLKPEGMRFKKLNRALKEHITGPSIDKSLWSALNNT